MNGAAPEGGIKLNGDGKVGRGLVETVTVYRVGKGFDSNCALGEGEG